MGKEFVWWWVCCIMRCFLDGFFFLMCFWFFWIDDILVYLGSNFILFFCDLFFWMKWLWKFLYFFMFWIFWYIRFFLKMRVRIDKKWVLKWVFFVYFFWVEGNDWFVVKWVYEVWECIGFFWWRVWRGFYEMVVGIGFNIWVVGLILCCCDWICVDVLLKWMECFWIF